MKRLLAPCLFVLSGVTFLIQPLGIQAEAVSGQGGVTVTGSPDTPTIDPEMPETPVDPEEKPSTTGDLRIDFAPSFRFGVQGMPSTTTNYPVLAQQFKNGKIRGNFIQLTDQRPTSTGWTLQIKQSRQFYQTTTQQELEGAVLRLDKVWSSSVGSGPAPVITRDTIALSTIGQTYDIARASPGQGEGVWMISFGATETNTSGQENTVHPLVDNQGKAVQDDYYQKPAFVNSAIQLSVPTTRPIAAGTYQTELTWLIGQLP